MNKQENKPETIDEYIATFPLEIQEIMQEVRRTILEAAPQLQETISWNMPTFKIKKILVQFAGHKHHLGFYPWPETIEDFKERLQGYKTSKGGIQFPYNKPMPLQLISDMVLFRLRMLDEENK